MITESHYFASRTLRRLIIAEGRKNHVLRVGWAAAHHKWLLRHRIEMAKAQHDTAALCSGDTLRPTVR